MREDDHYECKTIEFWAFCDAIIRPVRKSTSQISNGQRQLELQFQNGESSSNVALWMIS
jgi:hypothetical protein